MDTSVAPASRPGHLNTRSDQEPSSPNNLQVQIEYARRRGGVGSAGALTLTVRFCARRVAGRTTLIRGMFGCPDTLDGMFFRTRAGCPWRDLPER